MWQNFSKRHSRMFPVLHRVNNRVWRGTGELNFDRKGKTNHSTNVNVCRNGSFAKDRSCQMEGYIFVIKRMNICPSIVSIPIVYGNMIKIFCIFRKHPPPVGLSISTPSSIGNQYSVTLRRTSSISFVWGGTWERPPSPLNPNTRHKQFALNPVDETQIVISLELDGRVFNFEVLQNRKTHSRPFSYLVKSAVDCA